MRFLLLIIGGGGGEFSVTAKCMETDLENCWITYIS